VSRARNFVLSNRQPYRHSYDDDGDGITVDAPTGGLTAGLDAVMRQVNGTWIAWGDGDADADVVDENGQVTVPPGSARGSTPSNGSGSPTKQVDNYYYGFSNRVLWPICHSALTNVDGNARFWDHYQGVNERFADAVADSADARSVVWFHDYHLGLAAEMVQGRIPEGAFCIHTWHPVAVVGRVPRLPARTRGTARDARQRPRRVPRPAVLRQLPAVRLGGAARGPRRLGRTGASSTSSRRRRFVRFRWASRPTTSTAGPSAPRPRRSGATSATPTASTTGRKSASASTALDYTKGIPADRGARTPWESSSQWRESFTFVQVGTETRSQITAYDDYQQRVEDAIDDVNERFGTDDWQPIVYDRTTWQTRRCTRCTASPTSPSSARYVTG